MLGMQAGTPGGVIAHDSRTLEMCATMVIPVRMHDDMPPSFAASDLPSLFEFDPAAYDCRRSELANRYVDMLTAAGITPSVGLLSLARSEPAAPECVALQRTPELAVAS
jgi:hypothetical protein